MAMKSDDGWDEDWGDGFDDRDEEAAKPIIPLKTAKVGVAYPARSTPEVTNSPSLTKPVTRLLSTALQWPIREWKVRKRFVFIAIVLIACLGLIVSYTRRLEATAGGLEPSKVEAAIRSLKRDITTLSELDLEARLAAIEGRVDGVGEAGSARDVTRRVEAIERSLDTATKAKGGAGAAVDTTVLKKLEALESRLSSLEDSLRSLPTGTALSSLDSRLSELIGQLEERLGKVEGKGTAGTQDGATSTQVKDLKAQVKAADAKAGDASSSAASAAKALTRLEKTLRDVEERLSKANNAIIALQHSRESWRNSITAPSPKASPSQKKDDVPQGQADRDAGEAETFGDPDVTGTETVDTPTDADADVDAAGDNSSRQPVDPASKSSSSAGGATSKPGGQAKQPASSQDASKGQGFTGGSVGGDTSASTASKAGQPQDADGQGSAAEDADTGTGTGESSAEEAQDEPATGGDAGSDGSDTAQERGQADAGDAGTVGDAPSEETGADGAVAGDQFQQGDGSAGSDASESTGEESEGQTQSTEDADAGADADASSALSLAVTQSSKSLTQALGQAVDDAETQGQAEAEDGEGSAQEGGEPVDGEAQEGQFPADDVLEAPTDSTSTTTSRSGAGRSTGVDKPRVAPAATKVKRS